jgi:hypothetical protein
MSYDMGCGQKLINKYLPDKFKNIMTKDTNIYLDIGSGGGKATIHHLNNFFGKDIEIILSDLHPRTEQWRKLNVQYINKSFNIYKDINYLKKKHNITMFGTLHHLTKKEINSLLIQIKRNKQNLFIVEPVSFSRIFQFLHILTIPIYIPILYTYIYIICSLKSNDLIINKIVNFIITPYILTIDHIIGASRRYNKTEIQKLSKNNNLTLYHHNDNFFDYYIIK